MKSLSVHEVKTNFSSLVNSVAADGEVIVVMRYGKAVA
jgi:antitoxin (DNA-binding transcriptional repressor) of toxin-antitoxin stability system